MPGEGSGQRLGSYRLIRRLGAGGTGVVHEALDDARGLRVALKTLTRMSPRALYRFKREFRSVADLVHPNLVRLYELGVDEGTWFLTMELVEGVHFPGFLGEGAAPGAPGLPPGLEQRLRDSLRQLAEAVAALHAGGLLHRDLKPANVLVEPGGRVVVLDFGLVQPAVPAPGAAREGPQDLAGTPSYLSPEQVSGQQPTPASDWYAVGMMLFEALTGVPPFRGSIWESLLARTNEPAPRPSSVRPGIPEDLDDLCALLLAPDPGDRPPEDEVLRRLGASPRGHAPPPARAPRLIGREAELAALTAAYRRVGPGAPASVYLRGPSGIGKTALARSFLDQVRERDDALILAGRCYEWESVPYKAFDPIIDALARQLQGRPVPEQRALLDEDAHHAARLFPVLWGCQGLAEIPAPQLEEPDPVALRRRGFVALKRILGRLGEQRRVVIFIDDLQWGDADSARFAWELLSPPGAPALLLAGAYRDDEAEHSRFLAALGALSAAAGARHEGIEIDVGALPLEDAVALARASGAGVDPEWPRQIAVESGGNPFFVEALSRYAAEEAEAPGARPAALAAPGAGARGVDRLVAGRLSQMPEECARVLRVVALAGQPLGQDLAVKAAHLEGEDPQAALAYLRAAHLVRTRGPRGEDAVETYHDRIREVVVARLTGPELRRAHADLARTLEASPGAEPELLARHLHGAGEPARAAVYALEAAERADAALAFDRAAELYGQALAWGEHAPARRRELLARRGRALVNAGRSAAAAPLFLEASRGEGVEGRRELVRLAAEAYLVAGHIDEGLAVLRPLRAELGIGYPASNARATLSLVEQLVRLQIRGIDFVRRADPESPVEELARADLCWSLGKGLFAVLPSQGVGFMLRSLRCALGAGEPVRIGRSLAYAGALLQIQGGAAARRGEAYLARAEALTSEVGDPRLQATVLIWRAHTHLFAGRWRAVIDHADRGLEILDRRCTGVRWESVMAATLALLGLEALGDVREVEQRARQHAREAADHGDLYAQVVFTQFVAFYRAARGDTAGARRDARRALELWTREAYTVQHLYAMRIEAYCDLYEGAPEAARARLLADWPRIRRAQLLRVPMSRVDALLLAARVQLSLARGHRRGALLRSCEEIARRLSRERARPEGWPSAALIRAGIAAVKGDRGLALALLERSIARFEALDMGLLAAAARRRRGELLGDAEQVAAADAWMRQRGIADPARWVRVLAPGFDSAAEALRAA